MDKEFNDIKSIMDDIRDALIAGWTIVDHNGKLHTVLPESYELQSFPNVDPSKIIAKRNFLRLSSLIDYVQRFMTPGTCAYVSPERVVALIDHHGQPEGAQHAELHRAYFDMLKSVEWEAWMARDGKLFSQQEFAEFIDQHIDDIFEPDGATILEIAMTMRSNTNVEFASKVTLANDRINLVFREVEDAKAGRDQELAIPEHIAISIPVFLGGNNYPIRARLLYSTKAGVLRIGYRLHRPDQVLDDAMNDIGDKIVQDCGISVYFGSPGQPE